MTIEIVNDLLKSAGSTERAYGYASDNDAGLQILTEELFRYIRTLPLSDYWKPFEANEVKF
jgi:hypothetical protein